MTSNSFKSSKSCEPEEEPVSGESGEDNDDGEVGGPILEEFQSSVECGRTCHCSGSRPTGDNGDKV